MLRPSEVYTLGYAIVLPVPGPGFRGRFGTNFGRKPTENESKAGPKRPGPSARAVWDRFLVRSHSACGQHRPKTGPGSPVRGPEALLCVSHRFWETAPIGAQTSIERSGATSPTFLVDRSAGQLLGPTTFRKQDRTHITSQFYRVW